MGLAAITIGLTVVALKGEVTDLFRRSSSFTPMPSGAFTPGLARFTGIVIVVFGGVLLVVAAMLLAR